VLYAEHLRLLGRVSALEQQRSLVGFHEHPGLIARCDEATQLAKEALAANAVLVRTIEGVVGRCDALSARVDRLQARLDAKSTYPGGRRRPTFQD
jgi:hypothetical protein